MDAGVSESWPHETFLSGDGNLQLPVKSVGQSWDETECAGQSPPDFDLRCEPKFIRQAHFASVGCEPQPESTRGQRTVTS